MMSTQNVGGVLPVPNWMVWVFAIFFVGYGLGSYPLLDNNEGLYAEIAREMLVSRDWHFWIIPRLNDLVYMEKPPLLYWLTATSFAIFGQSPWAARLIPAISTLVTVSAILTLSRYVKRENAGRIAAIFFVSGLGVTAMSRTLMFDMLLTALLSNALVWSYIFFETKQKKSLYIVMVSLSLALLAKGFVSIILFGSVIFFFLLTQAGSIRNFNRLAVAWFDWRALALFILVAMPWHIVATVTEPIFAWFYFVNEHVLRFLGKREPHDYYAGAWWYYIPRMFIYLFPWSFLLPIVLFAKSQMNANKSLHFFLAAAWLAPLLFFSISSAKANYYLVTVMPFFAFQLAILLEDRNFGGRIGIASFGVVIAVLFSLIAIEINKSNLPFLEQVLVYGVDGRRFILFAVILIAALAISTAVLCWFKPAEGAFVYFSIPVLILLLSIGLLQGTAIGSSSKILAENVVREGKNREIFFYRIFEEKSSLPFYLKHPVRIVDSRSSDLFWGNKLHHNNIVLSDSLFERLSATENVGLVVMNHDIAEFEGKTYSHRFKVKAKIGNATLFSN